MNTLRRLALICFVIGVSVRADGPADNLPDKVRRVPPPGIAIPAAGRAELEAGAAQLGREIEALRRKLKGKPALLELLPDAQIFHKAVDWALRHDEFYKTNEVQTARAPIRCTSACRVESSGGAPRLLTTAAAGSQVPVTVAVNSTRSSNAGLVRW
jgi:hypothetical protein